MKEFNLSKRYIPIRNVNGIFPCDVYEQKDVKEFIKKLKEEMKSQSRFVDSEDGLFLADYDIDEIINKLAGEKLK